MDLSNENIQSSHFLTVINNLLGVLWQNFGMLVFGGLAAIGMLLLGAALIVFSLGLLVLGLAIKYWNENDLIKSMGTLLEDIVQKIRNMMLALIGRNEASGNNNAPTSGDGALDMALAAFSAVVSGAGIIVLSISLLVFSVALLLLGVALSTWKDKGYENIIGDVFTNVAKGIRELADTLLGKNQQAGAGIGAGLRRFVNNIPIVGDVLGLLGAVAAAGTIIVISVSLLLFGAALLVLGKALKEWKASGSNLESSLSTIGTSIKNLFDTLMGKNEGNFFEKIVSNIPLVGDVVGALSAVSRAGSIILLSVSLMTFAVALQELTKGAIAIYGKSSWFINIGQNIGSCVKSLLESIEGKSKKDLEKFGILTTSLIEIGKALNKLSQINLGSLERLTAGVKDDGTGGLLYNLINSVIKGLTKLKVDGNIEKSINSLNKIIFNIARLCNALSRLKSEDQLSKVALGVGKIQSTITKTTPTDKALKAFSTIMYHLCKISYAADKFEKFTKSFKTFTGDMEKFKNILNGFDGEKLKDFIKLNKIQLELSKEADAYNKFVKELENYFKTYSAELQNIFTQFTEFETAMAQARAKSAEDLVSQMGDKQGEELTKFLIGMTATNGDGTAAICAKLDELKLYLNKK